MDNLSIRRIKKARVALVMAVWMFGLIAFPSLAAAALTPSRTTTAGSATISREADLQSVRTALENKLVAQKLKDYGLNTSEVQAKLTRMSDADVHQVAMLSNKLPQGGDDVLVVGGFVTILIVVILIIVLIHLLHHDVAVR